MKFFLTLLPLLAFAAPQGLHVMSGNAEVVGHEVRVTESSVLHWDSYSIDHHEHIHYPATHATVNRVIGNDISKIHGRLSSNGPLWLINPNGIVIGKSGRINAASFLASTLDLLDGPEFIFAGDRGRVEQHGVIECPGGYVTLLSAESVVQTGEIHAEKVAIGVGREILFTPKDSPLIAIRQSGLEKPSFAAGIQCKGLIEATRFEERGGEVYLVADKVVVEKETMLRGNDVRVLGKEVAEFYGEIEAPGGFAEVSSPRQLVFEPVRVQTRGPNGERGKLLLDPSDINITAATDDGYTGSCPTFTPNADTMNISVTTLQTCLEGPNDVVLSATSGLAGAGNITVSAAALAWNSSGSLTLEAERAITVSGSGALTCAGSGDITLTASGTAAGTYVGVTISAPVETASGNVTISGKGGTTSGNGVAVSAGASIVGEEIRFENCIGQEGTTNICGIIISGGTIGSTVTTTLISLEGIGNQGASATGSNDGVRLAGGTIQTSTAGAVHITGTGGGNPALTGSANDGIDFAAITTITTGTSMGQSLVLTGIGGSGSQGNHRGVIVQSAVAPVLTIGGVNPEVEFLNCQGGDGGTLNVGVQFNAGFDAGLAALKFTDCHGGTGETSAATFHYGVYCNAGIVTGATIEMTGIVGGHGATGATAVTSNFGFHIDTGATLGSATTSLISIEATGGSGEGATNTNYGIRLAGGTVRVEPTTGTIALTGTGGGDPSLGGSSNMGIDMEGTATAIITGTSEMTGKSLTLTGIGGSGSGGSHRGVLVSLAPTLTIGGTGPGGAPPEVEFLNCQGGSGGSNNRGVQFDAGFDAGVATGVALKLTNIEGGTGGTSGVTQHYGVYCNAGIVTGATIEMIGLVGGQGAMGATAVTSNHGFFIDSGATLGTSAMAPMPSTSSISIEGMGGSGEGVTSSNIGVTLGGGTIQANPTTGTVTLMGTGGGNLLLSGSGNHGIHFSVATAITTGTSMGQSFTLTGAGGSGSGGFHRGVLIAAAQTPTIGGTDPVVEFLNCQGGNGGTANEGVRFDAGFNVGAVKLKLTDCTGGTGGTSGSTTHYGVYCNAGTVTGATIEMTGIVGGQGAMGATAVTSNRGFIIDAGAQLGTTSTTSISITATGGSGEGVTSSNYGVNIAGGTLQTDTTMGTITLTGTGGGNPALAGNNNHGIFGGTAIISTGTTLTLTGMGGQGSGGVQHGAVIPAGSTMTVTLGGMNPIVQFLNCQGGDGGTGNRGVVFDSGFDVGSAALHFTDCHGGTGGTSASTLHYGVYCNTGTVTGATIEMTGIVGGHGAAGATNVSNNYGFHIDTGATLGTTSGMHPTTSIIIEATGGNGEGTTSGNLGIRLAGGTLQVEPTTGAISLTGTGGGDPLLGGADNRGIEAASSSMTIITGTSMEGKSLTFKGIGGAGGGGQHYGVNMVAAPVLTLGGTDPVVEFFECRGGTNGNTNVGVRFGADFETGAALLKLTDCRGGNGANSHGISTVAGTINAGSVTMEGIAISDGSDSSGILLARPTIAAGPITFNGTSLAAGANSHGISITFSSSTSSSGLLQMTGSSASAFDINLGANITHSGAFTCHSPLRIDGTTRTITSAGATTFADTIDAVTTGGLTLSAGSGLIALEGALGSLVPLGPVSLTTSHGTGVELRANATASSFTTTDTTKVKLFQPTTTIDTTGAISFGGTVDGDTAGTQSLTLNAGDTITIGGIVGGATGLGTFEATASNVLLNADITATEGTFDADVTVTGDRILK